MRESLSRRGPQRAHGSALDSGRGRDPRLSAHGGAARARQPADAAGARPNPDDLYPVSLAECPPLQIVPALADDGVSVASESSFYLVLRDAEQLQHQGKARAPPASWRNPPGTRPRRPIKSGVGTSVRHAGAVGDRPTTPAGCRPAAGMRPHLGRTPSGRGLQSSATCRWRGVRSRAA